MSTATRACTACMTPLPEEAHFCLQCGTPTPADEGVPTRTTATTFGEIARVRRALSTRGYAIDRIIGEGGMATVYLATDEKHRRQVAVKVMRPELSATLGAERFLREVEIAAQLSHPHILPVHDSGEVDGVLYYVMPFVEGESLHERVRRETQLPVDEALRIAREVSEALAYAHGKRIVHRDIKPANIMLSAGHALVADFGIARAVGGAAGASITRTGLAVGTPQYMSPEQASGSPNVDARSDIYAVGAVLYEMLAGEPPFTGPTAQVIVTRSFTETPRPLSATREGISPAIEAVVQRALVKNPADRWQSAVDFAKALRGAEDQLRMGPISGERTPAPMAALGAGPGAVRVWAVFGVASALALSLVYGLVRRWGLPGWALVLAIVLLAIGAVVLAVTGKMEARRAKGARVARLGAPFTWRNATLGGVGALGLWALVAMALVYRGPASAASRADVVRLAVLPFENRGAADDGYFVEGVADQVRGKLMNVAGFQVIARASTDQYKGSTKTPQEIGRELGVDYLLTSTVTWVKVAGEKGRVQVVPELINVKTGAGTWQQSFDAELTDIFQVQTSIASQVAGALNVALAPKEATELSARPTRSLEAYDFYLKARAMAGNSPAEIRETIGLYKQAVAIDSSFAAAWGEMAYSLSRLYFNSSPTPTVAAEAKRAVERANALAPQSATALYASSRYKQLVRNDIPGAIQDGMAALMLAPNDPAMLRLATTLEQIQGRLPEALAHAEVAARLDPRGAPTRTTLAEVLIKLGKYPEAISLLEAVITESPRLLPIMHLVTAHLKLGDLASARRVIAPTPPGISRADLVAYLGVYNDLYWILAEPDQQLLLTLGAEHFDGDRSNWALTLMQLYHSRGQRVLALAYADTARMEIQKQLLNVPNDPQRNLFLGMAQAVLGHQAEGIAAAERGDRLMPAEKDEHNGTYMRHRLIRVYMILGENEKALDLLEPLMKMPYLLTPQRLAVDPNFSPLKGNPRFERLIAGATTTAR